MLYGNPAAFWYEHQPVNDTMYPDRVHNGFALLSLDGDMLNEEFINEDGSVVADYTWG
ncbi:hypothetical protein [Caballeronia mineralivorans]|uniref:hypothetical protein n=1 Tax=Caballeronia mineralivorans TaxID=2010198 RepID=UPI001364B10A|nr:hypothetical protein [Caballeronia mineralivorans]